MKILLDILLDERGGLGITRGSLTSSVCDDTGASGQDDVVKVRRLINRRGKQFCNICNWPFLRHDLSFSITNALGHTYSGSSYLPETFKRVIKTYLLYNTENYPLTEIGIKEFLELPRPSENVGRPEKFCITRMESSYWQVAFDKKPDQTYTAYFEIELQWTDLTEDTSETIFPKNYEDAFAHFCIMGRLKQQGDTESYLLYKDEWWNSRDPQGTILGQILANLSPPSAEKGFILHEDYINPFGTPTGDYDFINSYEEMEPG